MLYLSKGIGDISTSAGELRVSRCGREYILDDTLASVWLAGRRVPQTTTDRQEKSDIAWLSKFGLVVSTGESEPLGLYRLLTSCIICPTSKRFPFRRLNRRERATLCWVRRAGLRLTMAELVKLHESYPKPVSNLLGERNRQALVKSIYTTETIFDTLLENAMEHSPARDGTVQIILALLRKQRLILL